MINGPQVKIRYITSSGAQGTDYPIMTVALHIRPDAVPGAKTLFSLILPRHGYSASWARPR